MPSIPPPHPHHHYAELSRCHSLLSTTIPYSRAKNHCSCFGSVLSRLTSSSQTTMSILLFGTLLVNQENSPQRRGVGWSRGSKKCIKTILPGAHWPGFGWCFSTICGDGFTFTNFSKWPPTADHIESLNTQTTDTHLIAETLAYSVEGMLQTLQTDQNHSLT